MIKQTLTYPDLDGNQITEDFYFHLSKAELAEMEISKHGGMQAYLEGIVATQDGGLIINAFKEILKASIGRRDENGKRFTKSEEIWLEFSQSNAYDELFMKIILDANFAVEFVKGIMPANLDQVTTVRETVDPNLQPIEPATDEQPEVAPWIAENRPPTAQEVRGMSNDQLFEAFRLKMQSPITE